MRHITGIVSVAGGAAAAECTGRDPPVQSVPRYPGTEVQRRDRDGHGISRYLV